MKENKKEKIKSKDIKVFNKNNNNIIIIIINFF